MVPPMWCFVELPESDGELIPGVRLQFILVLVLEHEVQIPHEGDRSAKPLHPFCCCRLEIFVWLSEVDVSTVKRKRVRVYSFIS